MYIIGLTNKTKTLKDRGLSIFPNEKTEKIITSPSTRKSMASELRKINWVKRAINRFRQNSSYRKPDNLKKIHYEIIGDLINDEKQMKPSLMNEDFKRVFIHKSI